MAEPHFRRERLIWLRVLALGFAVAVVTQVAWIVPYYLVTNGCFCSHPSGPMPSWAADRVFSWLEIGTLPATAFMHAGIGLYAMFNAVFWMAVVLALVSVWRRYRVRIPRSR